MPKYSDSFVDLEAVPTQRHSNHLKCNYHQALGLMKQKSLCRGNAKQWEDYHSLFHQCANDFFGNPSGVVRQTSSQTSIPSYIFVTSHDRQRLGPRFSSPPRGPGLKWTDRDAVMFLQNNSGYAAYTQTLKAKDVSEETLFLAIAPDY